MRPVSFVIFPDRKYRVVSEPPPTERSYLPRVPVPKIEVDE
jgi:hypothetical protein